VSRVQVLGTSGEAVAGIESGSAAPAARLGTPLGVRE